ncbi:DddA-like double-stranded DNA deaminase toxin [Actinokineospora sp.]|uniref:DddA-like double-stranded DNA deaminase toxin n=1 Tax=Actinokineospora sp. TaxID=1872133 RepID=UPI004037BD7A
MSLLPAELVSIAHGHLSECYGILAPIAAGSSQAELRQAVAQLAYVVGELERVQYAFVTIRSAVQGLVTALVGTGTVSDVVRVVEPNIVAKRDETARPIATANAGNADGKRAADLLAKLPKRTKPGDKTSGYWMDEDGKEYGPLVSGEDEDYWRALEELRSLRIGPQRGAMWAVAHVEVKFAVRLRGSDRKRIRLVINNAPCFQGRFSCDRLLPQILRPDQEVTVYWPEGKRTYRGRRP